MSQNNEGSPAIPGQRRFFGHPAGLGTLFFTELWERFSYYGMRALLVLFMVATVTEGGLGFDDPTATAIYGLYTAGVYLAALPGGWLADRIFGQQNAIWYGGIIIAAGHIVLSLPGFGLVPDDYGFFLGLILIVVGTGLLKPNISSCVGELYPEGGSRRDAGYVLYYMGINLGAFLGPLICGLLRINFGWHWGFAAAAVGMIAGLIVYRITQKHLGEFGLRPQSKLEDESDDVQSGELKSNLFLGSAAILGALLIALAFQTFEALGLSEGVAHYGILQVICYSIAFSFLVIGLDYIRRILSSPTGFKGAIYFGTALIFFLAVMGLEGFIEFDVMAMAVASVFVIVAVAVVFYGRVLLDKSLTKLERNRTFVLIALFIGAALFWSGFEQAGSSLNLFAERYTARELLGIIIPAEAFQSLNPLYILIFAPFFSALWINLGRRNLDPSIPMKFAIGFAQLGIGFGFMWIAASLIQDGDQVLPTWLLLTYLFHTTGELCVSPIGLSATSKLAPRRYYSQMMGMWFFGAALGNLLAGLLAGEFSGDRVSEFPDLYRDIVIFCGVVTVGFLVATPFLKKMAALDQVHTDDLVREDEPGAYEGGGSKHPRD